MQQRRVSQAAIDWVLDHPTNAGPGPSGRGHPPPNRMARYWAAQNMTYVVVVAANGNIVTVWRTPGRRYGT